MNYQDAYNSLDISMKSPNGRLRFEISLSRNSHSIDITVMSGNQTVTIKEFSTDVILAFIDALVHYKALNIIEVKADYVEPTN